MPFEADGSYTDEYGNNSGAPAEVTTQVEAPAAVADPGTDDSYGWLAALEAANAAAPQNGGSVEQQTAVVNNANEVLQSQPADAQNNPDYASNLDQAYFASAGASDPNATPAVGTGVPGVGAQDTPVATTATAPTVPAAPTTGGTITAVPAPTGPIPNATSGPAGAPAGSAGAGYTNNFGILPDGTWGIISVTQPNGTVVPTTSGGGATPGPGAGGTGPTPTPGVAPNPAPVQAPVPGTAQPPAPAPTNPPPATGTTPVPGAGTTTPPPPMPGGPGVGDQTGGTIVPTQQLLDDFLSSDPDLVLNLVQNRFRAQGASPVFLTWFNRNFQRYWGEYLGVIGQLAANGSIEGPMFIDWMLNQDNMHDFFTDTSGRIDTRFGLNRTADTGAQGVTV